MKIWKYVNRRFVWKKKKSVNGCLFEVLKTGPGDYGYEFKLKLCTSYEKDYTKEHNKNNGFIFFQFKAVTSNNHLGALNEIFLAISITTIQMNERSKDRMMCITLRHSFLIFHKCSSLSNVLK